MVAESQAWQSNGGRFSMAINGAENLELNHAAAAEA
jgi:hypothetical protein